MGASSTCISKAKYMDGISDETFLTKIAQLFKKKLDIANWRSAMVSRPCHYYISSHDFPQTWVMISHRSLRQI